MLDRHWIEAHIPHQGSMCLLDEVLEWSDEHIRCRTGSHKLPNNPLLAHGRLGSACGIEYAAQTMAVHGALLVPVDSSVTLRAGYLVSGRSVMFDVTRLDDVAADLVIEATCVMKQTNNILYEFNLSADGQNLVRGRAAVVLDAAALGIGGQP